MKTFFKLTAAAAALAGLSACDMLGLNKEGGDTASTNAAGNATASSNASATTPTAGADGSKPAGAGATPASTPFTGQVNAAFLIGRWTDTGDCNVVVEFLPDGRFTTPGGNGVWVLDGDRLTFQGSSTRSARVQAPNQDTIMLIHGDGSVGRSTRCPA